jgi:hypothetical protein
MDLCHCTQLFIISELSSLFKKLFKSQRHIPFQSLLYIQLHSFNAQIFDKTIRVFFRLFYLYVRESIYRSPGKLPAFLGVRSHGALSPWQMIFYPPAYLPGADKKKATFRGLSFYCEIFCCFVLLKLV